MSKRIPELADAGTLTGDEDVELARPSAISYTSTTISFDASDNSINDSAGQLIAEGLAAGMSVRISGASNGANNLYTGRIATGLTTAKAVILSPEGDAIVTEAAGATVTITVLESARTTTGAIAGLATTGAADIAAATHAASSKATPVDADELPLVDSAASFGLKKLTWANLKATLKTHTDTLYAAIGEITGSGLTMATGKLLGRSTGSTGAVEEITVGAGLTLSGGTLSAASGGDVSAAANLTDNAIVRGDGGTKGVQTSGFLIDDDNKISGYKGNTNTQTGTSYTLGAADTGKIVELSNASAISLTLPATAAVGFACTLVQAGAGQVSFASTGSGTVRNRQSHAKLAGQWAMASAYVRTNSGGSAAEWVISGDTTT